MSKNRGKDPTQTTETKYSEQNSALNGDGET